MPLAASRRAGAAATAAALLGAARRASAMPCPGYRHAPTLGVVSPACFDVCPGLCGPLDVLLVAAAHGGDEGSVLQFGVCSHVEHFECAYWVDACVPVLAEAAHTIGFELPKTEGELMDICGDEGEDSTESAGNETEGNETSGEICSGVADNTFVSISPPCFAMCPELCGPLGGILEQVRDGVDFRHVQRAICEQEGRLSCLYAPGHGDACHVVRRAAARFGASLPHTQAQLWRACNDFRASDRPAEPTTPSPTTPPPSQRHRDMRNSDVEPATTAAPRASTDGAGPPRRPTSAAAAAAAAVAGAVTVLVA